MASDETFFTVIGCMDGRCQEAVAQFGRKKFNADYPDTITQPGMVGILANGPTKEFLNNLRKEVQISISKHHSKGIIVDGHEECAASDAVDNENHKEHVKKSVQRVKALVDARISVVGVFVKRQKTHPTTWEVEELS